MIETWKVRWWEGGGVSVSEVTYRQSYGLDVGEQKLGPNLCDLTWKW